MGRLDQRVTIVTGAARGTGAAIVRRFAAEGASVLALDVLDDEGRALASELGPSVVFRHVDVTSEGDWSAAVDDVVERWGRLDVLVNNAAILVLNTIEQTTAERFRQVLEVNTIGAFLGVKACLPALRERGGTIVNVGSIDSISGAPTTGAYTASKFALRGLTKVVALEEGKYGIRCNIVCPGGGNPQMIAEAFTAGVAESGADDSANSTPARSTDPLPLGRRAHLDELAGAVLYFASDDSTYCTGTELVVDGGLHAGVYVDVPGLFRTSR